MFRSIKANLHTRTAQVKDNPHAKRQLTQMVSAILKQVERLDDELSDIIALERFHSTMGDTGAAEQLLKFVNEDGEFEELLATENVSLEAFSESDAVAQEGIVKELVRKFVSLFRQRIEGVDLKIEKQRQLAWQMQRQLETNIRNLKDTTTRKHYSAEKARDMTLEFGLDAEVVLKSLNMTQTIPSAYRAIIDMPFMSNVGGAETGRYVAGINNNLKEVTHFFGIVINNKGVIDSGLWEGSPANDFKFGPNSPFNIGYTSDKIVKDTLAAAEKALPTITTVYDDMLKVYTDIVAQLKDLPQEEREKSRGLIRTMWILYRLGTELSIYACAHWIEGAIEYQLNDVVKNSYS